MATDKRDYRHTGISKTAKMKLLLAFILAATGAVANRNFSTGYARFCDSLLANGGKDYEIKCRDHKPDPNFKPHPRRMVEVSPNPVARVPTDKEKVMRRKGIIKISDEAIKALETPTVTPASRNGPIPAKEIKIAIPSEMNATRKSGFGATGSSPSNRSRRARKRRSAGENKKPNTGVLGNKVTGSVSGKNSRRRGRGANSRNNIGQGSASKLNAKSAAFTSKKSRGDQSSNKPVSKNSHANGKSSTSPAQHKRGAKGSAQSIARTANTGHKPSGSSPDQKRPGNKKSQASKMNAGHKQVEPSRRQKRSGNLDSGRKLDGSSPQQKRAGMKSPAATSRKAKVGQKSAGTKAKSSGPKSGKPKGAAHKSAGTSSLTPKAGRQSLKSDSQANTMKGVSSLHPSTTGRKNRRAGKRGIAGNKANRRQGGKSKTFPSSMATSSPSTPSQMQSRSLGYPSSDHSAAGTKKPVGQMEITLSFVIGKQPITQ